MIGGGLAESLAVHVDSGVVSHYDAENPLRLVSRRYGII